MTFRQCSPWFLFAFLLAVAGVSWSAPVPKEKEPAKQPFEGEPIEPVEAKGLDAARLRTKSSNNLKQIALALHNYESANGRLPNNVVDKNGKPLLSWRVLLLPCLEEGALANDFKMDEPWDSENNIKLLEKMPKVFENPRATVKKKGYTVYLGFQGEGTLFEPGKKLSIVNIADGTSNTIFCVESCVAMPWTKPVDLPFDAKKDIPDFGKGYGHGSRPLVALCDGSVRSIDLEKISQQTLKNAITVADGNLLGSDWNDK